MLHSPPKIMCVYIHIEIYTWKKQVCLRKTEITVKSARRVILDSDKCSNNAILAWLHSHAFSCSLFMNFSARMEKAAAL